MAGFWSHAFDSLGDNLRTLNAVAGDVQDNFNPFSDEFMTGDAKQTAAEVERQRALEQGRAYDQAKADKSGTGGLALVEDAVGQTGSDVVDAVGDTVDKAVKGAGWLLDALTNPWVIGAVAVIVVAVVAAPYAAPVLKRLA